MSSRRRREEEITGGTDQCLKLWKSTLEACCDSNTIKKKSVGDNFYVTGERRDPILFNDRKKCGSPKQKRILQTENKRPLLSLKTLSGDRWEGEFGPRFWNRCVQDLGYSREEDSGIGKITQNKIVLCLRVFRSGSTMPSSQGAGCITSPLDAFLSALCRIHASTLIKINTFSNSRAKRIL
jgi:hypothetical protein